MRHYDSLDCEELHIRTIIALNNRFENGGPMCGVNGIYAYCGSAQPIDRDELVRTRDHMRARGPDGVGSWCSPDGRVGFGHRRLSLIDLSDAGAQPMATGDGAFIVTFNGEIYNYRELRRGIGQIYD